MPPRSAATGPRRTSAASPSRPTRRARTATTETRPPRRPGPVPTHARPADVLDTDTRALIFAAAATEFSTRGFDGASVDAIARAAHVNKAMLYYHFGSKLDLYREVVSDMLRAVGTAVAAIAAGDDPAPAKLARFIEALSDQKDRRPWFPPLMLREMAEGAPHLDADTLALMRTVFASFAAILDAGVTRRQFRRVHPVLAYLSILGPLMMNSVRERAAAQHGRANFPLFASVDRAELLAHMQHTALCMLTAAAAAPAKKDRLR